MIDRRRSARLAAILLAVCALALAACPEKKKGPEGNTCEGSVCGDTYALLAVEPAVTHFTVLEAGLLPGESSVHPFVVTDVNEGVLELEAPRLEYVAPAGADEDEPALALAPLAADFPMSIYRLGSDTYPQGLEVQVVYTRPRDTLPRTAKLVFESNAANGTVIVHIGTEAGVPRLVVDPQAVDFGLVPKDKVGTAALTVLNVGSKTLSLDGFQIQLDMRFGLAGDGFEVGGGPGKPLTVELDGPIAVPAGETRQLELTFVSNSPTPAEGRLVIFSDDPEVGTDGLHVPLTANKSGPCIVVTPSKVNFGGKIVGQFSAIDVTVESCGTQPLEVTSIQIGAGSSEDFGLDFAKLPAGSPPDGPKAGQPVVIQVNDTATFSVTFVPDEVNPKDADNVPIPDQGVVEIVSNAFHGLVDVPLQGAGADKPCPTAVCYVEEGEEVIPQTPLHLHGTDSYASFGSIAQWSWSVTQPTGSQETFVPSPSDPTPVFQPNVVGLYTFYLDVWDANHVKSCEPCAYQVLVQPDQAIHVELTWQTPGDPDETDTGEGVGTDVDLHFAHPSATGPDLDLDGLPDPWFDKDWDCFWYTAEPNWGSYDPTAEDDPSLDRDDTDGAGPENLNLAVPQEDVAYRIGVHFWDDHAFGDVLATVRVFSYATEIFSRTDQLLHRRDLWKVGEVSWPAAEVTSYATEGLEAIVPDYVNPFFFPP